MTYFQPIECHSAKEFLEILRPTSDIWLEASGKRWINGWLYRGQGSKSLPLLPRAWRDNQQIVGTAKKWLIPATINSHIEAFIAESNDERKYDSNFIERIRYVTFQACAEYDLVRRFTRFSIELGHEIADANGLLDMPDFLKTYLENVLTRPVKDDPSLTAKVSKSWNKSAIAIAQHHGIPTRLLDWTTHPLVAAYFAAEAVHTESLSKGELAVYALPLQKEIGFKIVRFPPTISDYLRVQHGLFIVDTWSDLHYLDTGKRLSFEESVFRTNFEYFGYSGTLWHSSVAPRIITLPVAQAEELLRLLWIEQITRAHLMPTLDNITAALKVRWACEQIEN